MTNVEVKISLVDGSRRKSNKSKKKSSNEIKESLKQVDDKGNDFTRVFGLDDFDQFSARASSGGSLYGVLRKQALQHHSQSNDQSSLDNIDNQSTLPDLQNDFTTHLNPQKSPIQSNNFLCPPDPTHPFFNKHRQYRSKSLVQPKKSLTDDKRILKFLHDYTAGREGSQLQPKLLAAEFRRHSEAALNYQMLLRNRQLNSNTDELSGKEVDLTEVEKIISEFNSPTEINIVKRRETRQNSIIVPAISISKEPNINKNTGGKNDMTERRESNMNLLQPTGLSVCRRRSFSIREDEVCNDGDEVVVVPMLQLQNMCIPLTGFVLNNKNNNDKQQPLPKQKSPRISRGGISRRNSARSWRDSSLNNSKKTLMSLTSNKSQPSSPSSPPLQPSDKQMSQHINPTENDDMKVGGREAEDTGPPLYRVLVLGGPGVGKTALTQQFLTSEYMAAQNTSFGESFGCDVCPLVTLKNQIFKSKIIYTTRSMALHLISLKK